MYLSRLLNCFWTWGNQYFRGHCVENGRQISQQPPNEHGIVRHYYYVIEKIISRRERSENGKEKHHQNIHNNNNDCFRSRGRPRSMCMLRRVWNINIRILSALVCQRCGSCVASASQDIFILCQVSIKRKRIEFALLCNAQIFSSTPHCSVNVTILTVECVVKAILFKVTHTLLEFGQAPGIRCCCCYNFSGSSLLLFCIWILHIS